MTDKESAATGAGDVTERLLLALACDLTENDEPDAADTCRQAAAALAALAALATLRRERDEAREQANIAKASRYTLDTIRAANAQMAAALREIAETEPEDKYWPGRVARAALAPKDRRAGRGEA